MSDFARLLFIINPNAGITKKESEFVEILEVFQEYNYETIVMFTKKRHDATEFVINHAGDDIDMIVCMGGDGTLNEVFAGVIKIGWEKPVGYIPAGSTNDFAVSLGLKPNHVEAARFIMENEAKYIDLASFNDRIFVYTASCGLFSKTSYETPQYSKNILGHFAYILEGMKDFSQFKPVYMEIETNDDIIQDEFILVSICNTFSLGGIMSFDKALVDLDDGYYEMLTIKKPRDIIQFNSIISALTEHKYNTHFTSIEKVKSVTIHVPSAEDWSLDGEKEEGKTKCEFKVLHNAVKLVY